MLSSRRPHSAILHPLPAMLRDYRVFLKQFFEHYHTTGSVLPSSGSLAKALCRYVKDGKGASSNGRAIVRPARSAGSGAGHWSGDETIGATACARKIA